MIPTLHINLLGGFQLFSGETPVCDIEIPRLQSLLAYLLLHSGVPQSRTHLAFMFWPDSTESQAHTNLRNVMHKLRQAVPNADAFLLIDRQTLSWKPSTQDAPTEPGRISRRMGQAPSLQYTNELAGCD